MPSFEALKRIFTQGLKVEDHTTSTDEYIASGLEYGVGIYYIKNGVLVRGMVYAKDIDIYSGGNIVIGGD